MNEQRNDGSQWVPYQPPPPSGKERVWIFIQRASFPVMLLLFVGGLGAFLYLSPSFETGLAPFIDGLDGIGTEVSSPSSPRAASSIDLDSLAEAEAEGGAEDEEGRLGTGYAHLSVFSEPSGATVFIDNDSVGVTPVNRRTLRSGVYIITVQKDNFFSADTVAIVRNDQAPIYSVALTPRAASYGEDRPVLADQSSQDVPPDTSPSRSNASADARSSADDEANTGETNAGTARQASPSEPDVTPRTSIASAPAPGTLRFTSEPSNARVELDGEVVGTTPLTLAEVEAGAHDVAFTQSGYDTVRTQLTLAPAGERDVQATLNRLEGRVRVLVQPWGSIYIDGQLHERNADVRYEATVPVGEHEIAAVHPALGRQTRTVVVRAGEQVSLTIDLRRPPPEEPGGVSAEGGSSTSER